LTKEPWEEHPDVWPTKAKFFAWLRGCFRRAIWNLSPCKIKFKNAHCSPPPEGYKGKAKSGANCALTGEWEGKSKLEVDHIQGECSLRDWDDVATFVRHLCPPNDNLQLVTKEAHKIKTLAERKGISFEAALLEKRVIAFAKLPAAQQIKVLQESDKCGKMAATNAKSRVALYRQIIEAGK
jgi:hypothetical protein